MKLNKSKGSKGKVHPSPSPSPSSSSSFSLSLNSTDPNTALNLLLPAAIITLISTLSLQDRQVLAYMITHSLKSSPVNPSPISDHHNNHLRTTKKSKPKKTSPTFDCDCFDCYTAYWFRWDSSPHRELIHQAIEAFEEHLATSEQPKKTGKSRRREKEAATPVVASAVAPVVVEGSSESGVSEEVEVGESGVHKEVEKEEEEDSGGHKEKTVMEQQQLQQHKGLARKMLPDVIGLFNSRLWNLWGPNV